MARFRRQSRGGVRPRAASAFATAEDRKGKTIQWESLIDEGIPDFLNIVLPTIVRTVGAFTTRAVAIIPVSVTRGAVTLERVRGVMDVYFSSVELAASFDNWPVHMTIQVVPAADGAIDLTSCLSPGNAADQESNRIIWPRLYYPRAGTTITGPGAVELHESNYVGHEVDIKVKRRFDRATWGLALVCETETNAFALHAVGTRLRALFRGSDGI